mgnify:FL=1
MRAPREQEDAREAPARGARNGHRVPAGEGIPARPGAGRRWPRWLARGPLENLSMALIGVGVVLMTQTFSETLYGWSFLVVLAGTLGFMVFSHFPE